MINISPLISPLCAPTSSFFCHHKGQMRVNSSHEKGKLNTPHLLQQEDAGKPMVVSGQVDVWGTHPHTAVWTCCSHEMSLSWWEENINLFDWMPVSIVLGVGGMPEGHQQTGLTKHQLKIVSPSNSAFLHHYLLFALGPLYTHISFIHSVLIQFLPCSGDSQTKNPQVPPYGAHI